MSEHSHQDDGGRGHETEGGRKTQATWSLEKSGCNSGAAQQEKYKAPTLGLEDDAFTVGTAQDAANFKEVRRRIGRYAAVNFKTGGSMAQTAIKRLEAPVITEPPDLETAGATKTQEKKREILYDQYHKDTNSWDEVKKRTYTNCFCYTAILR